MLSAPVAQLDRASDFGSEGLGFDSLRAYLKATLSNQGGFFIFELVQHMSNIFKIGHEFGLFDHLNPTSKGSEIVNDYGVGVVLVLILQKEFKLS